MLLSGLPPASKLLCIEPAEGMRIGFEKKLKEMTREHRGDIVVKVVDGAFDKITGAQDASVDMVSRLSLHMMPTSCLSSYPAFKRL